MHHENSIIRRFLKSTGIFFIGNVLSKAIVLLMLPVYTKYIVPSDYGFYDLSITYITVVSSMLFFDIWSSVMRFMYDSDDISYKYKAILSGWRIFGVSAAGYCLIGIGISCFMNIEYLGWILLYGLISDVQSMYDFSARGFEKNVDFAVSGIFNTLVTVLLNIVMIVGLHKDFSSLYIAAIVGNLIQVFYLECKIRVIKNARSVGYDKELTRQMFHYTLPLCINSVSYWLLTSFNRVVINANMGDAANGIYAIGNKFGSMIALVTGCFVYAWQDISFARQPDDPGNGVFYSRACDEYLLFLGTGTAALLPALSLFFPILVDKSYNASKETIPLFLLVAMVSSYSTFVGNIFYALKDTKTIFVSMVISCVFNLALCYPLISGMGLDGANLAIFLSFLLNILIRAFILKKKINFRISKKVVLQITIWNIASIVIFQFGHTVMNALWLICSIALALYLFRDVLRHLSRKNA